MLMLLLLLIYPLSARAMVDSSNKGMISSWLQLSARPSVTPKKNENTGNILYLNHYLETWVLYSEKLSMPEWTSREIFGMETIAFATLFSDEAARNESNEAW